MIHIIFILCQISFPVDGVGVVLEETVPVGNEMFRHRIKAISQKKRICSDVSL